MNLLWGLKILSNYCGNKNSMCYIVGQVIQISPLIVRVNLTLGSSHILFHMLERRAPLTHTSAFTCLALRITSSEKPSWTLGQKWMPYTLLSSRMTVFYFFPVIVPLNLQLNIFVLFYIFSFTLSGFLNLISAMSVWSELYNQLLANKQNKEYIFVKQ